jgi:hypothetical protein
VEPLSPGALPPHLRGMPTPVTGYGHGMDDRERPTTNQPLNAPGPRPKVTPVLAVVGLIALIAAIFVVISLLRYNT